jgi:hypothetical protein
MVHLLSYQCTLFLRTVWYVIDHLVFVSDWAVEYRCSFKLMIGHFLMIRETKMRSILEDFKLKGRPGNGKK